MTVVLLTSEPGTFVTVTRIAMLAVSPGASAPRSAVTVPLAPTAGPAHTPRSVVHELKVVPAGSGSVTTTPVAVSGPALDATNV